MNPVMDTDSSGSSPKSYLLNGSGSTGPQIFPSFASNSS